MTLTLTGAPGGDNAASSWGGQHLNCVSWHHKRNFQTYALSVKFAPGKRLNSCACPGVIRGIIASWERLQLLVSFHSLEQSGLTNWRCLYHSQWWNPCKYARDPTSVISPIRYQRQYDASQTWVVESELFPHLQSLEETACLWWSSCKAYVSVSLDGWLLAHTGHHLFDCPSGCGRRRFHAELPSIRM